MICLKISIRHSPIHSTNSATRVTLFKNFYLYNMMKPTLEILGQALVVTKNRHSRNILRRILIHLPLLSLMAGTLPATAQQQEKPAKPVSTSENTTPQIHASIQFGATQGDRKDMAQTIESLTKAAEQGNVHAQYDLGLCYIKGTGVEQDWEKAIYWTKKAADQGLVEAENNTGICYASEIGGHKKDTKQAVEWFKKAANHGNANSQFMLGVYYLEGLGGLDKDFYSALQWLQKAADQGQKNAIAALALIENKKKSPDTIQRFQKFLEKQNRVMQ